MTDRLDDSLKFHRYGRRAAHRITRLSYRRSTQSQFPLSNVDGGTHNADGQPGGRETNLNLCANPPPDLFRLASARSLELGRNVSWDPQGSTRPSLLGTDLQERRVTPVPTRPLSPSVRNFGLQPTVSGRYQVFR